MKKEPYYVDLRTPQDPSLTNEVITSFRSRQHAHPIFEKTAEFLALVTQTHFRDKVHEDEASVGADDALCAILGATGEIIGAPNCIKRIVLVRSQMYSNFLQSLLQFSSDDTKSHNGKVLATWHAVVLHGLKQLRPHIGEFQATYISSPTGSPVCVDTQTAALRICEDLQHLCLADTPHTATVPAYVPLSCIAHLMPFLTNSTSLMLRMAPFSMASWYSFVRNYNRTEQDILNTELLATCVQILTWNPIRV
jgi:hypothetical protein